MHTGELPLGCRLCEKGAKLVLFVTGRCGFGCFYCPLSEKRKDRDLVWANERRVESREQVLEEAFAMDALGAGITGGDPLIPYDRTTGYIDLLKNSFGTDFHIHLYTATPASEDRLKELLEGGLDEIRFHIPSYHKEQGDLIWQSIKKSVDLGLSTGMELPSIPGTEEELISLTKRFGSLGGDFLNLNELEFSLTNQKELEKEGFYLEDDLSHGALGSRETALKVMDECNNSNIHFCSSNFKDNVQLRNRLLRRGQRTMKEYESLSEEGLFIKGIIVPQDIFDLEDLRKRLIKIHRIPPALIGLDLEKKRLETSLEIALFLADENLAGSDVFYIEEYPTSDRLETLRMRLPQ